MYCFRGITICDPSKTREIHVVLRYPPKRKYHKRVQILAFSIRQLIATRKIFFQKSTFFIRQNPYRSSNCSLNERLASCLKKQSNACNSFHASFTATESRFNTPLASTSSRASACTRSLAIFSPV